MSVMPQERCVHLGVFVDAELESELDLTSQLICNIFLSNRTNQTPVLEVVRQNFNIVTKVIFSGESFTSLEKVLTVHL